MCNNSTPSAFFAFPGEKDFSGPNKDRVRSHNKPGPLSEHRVTSHSSELYQVFTANITAQNFHYQRNNYEARHWNVFGNLRKVGFHSPRPDTDLSEIFVAFRVRSHSPRRWIGHFRTVSAEATFGGIVNRLPSVGIDGFKVKQAARIRLWKTWAFADLSITWVAK